MSNKPDGYPEMIHMPDTMWTVRRVGGGIMYLTVDLNDAERYADDCRSEGLDVEVNPTNTKPPSLSMQITQRDDGAAVAGRDVDAGMCAQAR